MYCNGGMVTMVSKLNSFQRYVALKQAALPVSADYDDARLFCVRYLDVNIPDSAYARLQFDNQLWAYLPQDRKQ